MHAVRAYWLHTKKKKVGIWEYGVLGRLLDVWEARSARHRSNKMREIMMWLQRWKNLNVLVLIVIPSSRRGIGKKASHVGVLADSLIDRPLEVSLSVRDILVSV